MDNNSTLNQMAAEMHAATINKGFWNDWQTLMSMEGLPYEMAPFPFNRLRDLLLQEKLLLINSEVAEAQEELRNGKNPYNIYYKIDAQGNEQPDGFIIEVIDAIYRGIDILSVLGVDIQRTLIEKHNYNVSRPSMHGGKRF